MSKTQALRRRAVLPALLGGDLRALCARGGLGAMLAGAVLCGLILRLLGADARRAAQPILLLCVPALTCLYVAGAMAMAERAQRVLPALRVTRMRPGQYLCSKLIVLSLPGAALAVLAAWLGGGETDVARLLLMAVPLLAMGLLAACAGLMAARLAATGNRFVLLSIPAALLLLGPAAWEALAPLPHIAGYHPGVLALRLLAEPGLLLPTGLGAAATGAAALGATTTAGAATLSASGASAWTAALGAATATASAAGTAALGGVSAVPAFLQPAAAWCSAQGWLPDGPLCLQLLALLGWLALAILLARHAVRRMLGKEVRA